MSYSSNSSSASAAVSAADKYLFDLNGYLVVRGVLSKAELASANAAVDAHKDSVCERSTTSLRNTASDSALSGDGKTGRRDLGGMLGWSASEGAVFRSILAHPRLVPYYIELLGMGYRMDHQPFCILSNAGCDGFDLHGGTVDVVSGAYNPELAYHFAHGKGYNRLLAVSVALHEARAGDGGFIVLPGSHKANLPAPPELVRGLAHAEHLVQPVLEAGDVVLFSEGTVHGARPWLPTDRERRIALYRFSPSTVAYGRSYTPSWPSTFLEHCTPAEAAVMLPPYHTRIERPCVGGAGGEVIAATRSVEKKAFDRKVFGTEYF